MESSSPRCPFCIIARTYPPSPSFVPQNPDSTLIAPNCHLILSTESVIAFLDILPMVPGHVLVVSRQHREKLGHLNSSEGAALGMWLPAVCRATMRALGKDDGDWNVVQNNGVLSSQGAKYWRRALINHPEAGASAAQIVPHVHYHIIPRGGGSLPELKARSWTMFGRGQREELDDDDGIKIAAAIRKELEKDLQSMAEHDVKNHKLLERL